MSGLQTGQLHERPSKRDPHTRGKTFFTLSERPELSLSDPSAPNDIFEVFERLPASEQRKFVSLHYPDRPDCNPGVSIYEANCFEMRSGTCICLDASRINHSCAPNAHYSWNDDIKRETVHTVRDIAKNEKVTISYYFELITPAYQMLTTRGTTTSNEKRCMLSGTLPKTKRSRSATASRFAASRNADASSSHMASSGEICIG